MTTETETETKGDIRVCRKCGEPVVFTFEFRGAEYYCVECGATDDIFAPRAPATVELQHRLDELTERYERDRAERAGTTYKPSPKAGDVDVALPTCKGCGATPAEGVTLTNGKPASWFTRTIDGVTDYACSRSCINEGMIAPW